MKNNTIICPLLILCALICLSAQLTFAKEKEIFVDSDNLFSSGQTKPIQDLIQAIHKHQNSSLFRITWNSSASLARDYSVILYNKQRHTLKYYYSVDWLISDDEPITRAKSSESILYTGVKDSMMPRLLKEFDKLGEMERSGTDADKLFPKLVKFGAKKHQLAKTYRKYIVEQER